jgi:hypothetical protein
MASLLQLLSQQKFQQLLLATNSSIIAIMIERYRRRQDRAQALREIQEERGDPSIMRPGFVTEWAGRITTLRRMEKELRRIPSASEGN